jgi:hypothetical protein
MVFSKVGPNQSIEWGQIRVSKSKASIALNRVPGHVGTTRNEPTKHSPPTSLQIDEVDVNLSRNRWAWLLRAPA